MFQTTNQYIDYMIGHFTYHPYSHVNQNQAAGHVKLTTQLLAMAAQERPESLSQERPNRSGHKPWLRSIEKWDKHGETWRNMDKHG